MGDVTVTAAAPTFPIPPFLETWEEDISTSTVHVFKKVPSGEAPGPYEQVQLHNFRFLGQEFKGSGYVGRRPSGEVVSTHSGAGVCAEFKAVLVTAQRRIYQDFARQQAMRGEAPNQEAAFKEYCGIKGAHGGWEFRGGNHRFGNALDIDSLFNPYITVGRRPRSGETVGKPSSLVGGEQPRVAPTEADAEALVQLRLDAITAYENSVLFMLGEAEGERARSVALIAQPGGSSVKLFSRFATLSEAMAWYMSTAMLPNAKNKLPLNTPDEPRSLDEMREQLRLHLDFKLKKTNPSLSSLLSDPAGLSRLRDQIVADHEAVRQTMLFGSWEIRGQKVVGATTTRDPCNGILSLRQEVVVGLRESGTRWGAGDFGSKASGDVMHFDTLTKPAMTTDPNSGQVTYAAT